MKKCKITPELTKNAVKYIKDGFTYSALAAGLGISEDTLYSWFRKGKEQKQPYLSFYASVKAAESELLSECLQAVKASMKSGDAKSAYFLLERRFSSEYGKSSQLNVNAKTENQNLNLNVNTEMTVDERRMAIVRILDKLNKPSFSPERAYIPQLEE